MYRDGPISRFKKILNDIFEDIKDEIGFMSL